MPTRSPLSRHRAVLLVAAALLFAPMACSSDDGGGASTTTEARRTSTTTADVGPPDTRDDDVADATEADYVAALEANFGRSGDVFSPAGIACLSARWVEVIGADTFREAGVAPDELARNRADLGELEMSRSTAEALADAFEDCGLALRDAYLKTLEGDLSEQGEICVDEMLTPEVVRQAFVAELLGEDLEPDPLLQVERCTR